MRSRRGARAAGGVREPVLDAGVRGVASVPREGRALGVRVARGDPIAQRRARAADAVKAFGHAAPSARNAARPSSASSRSPISRSAALRFAEEGRVLRVARDRAGVRGRGFAEPAAGVRVVAELLADGDEVSNLLRGDVRELHVRRALDRGEELGGTSCPIAGGVVGGLFRGSAAAEGMVPMRVRGGYTTARRVRGRTARGDPAAEDDETARGGFARGGSIARAREGGGRRGVVEGRRRRRARGSGRAGGRAAGVRRCASCGACGRGRARRVTRRAIRGARAGSDGVSAGQSRKTLAREASGRDISERVLVDVGAVRSVGFRPSARPRRPWRTTSRSWRRPATCTRR